MSEPLYWQLRYADGRVVDEPEEGASILLTPPRALTLVVCKRTPDGLRQPLIQVPLITDERPPGHGPWQPVFYRKRSMGLGGGSRLDLVVFGRGCEGPHTVDGTLWAIDRAGNVIDCPEWARDAGAVESLVMQAGEV